MVVLEELRHECGVSRDGSKASNVLKAARKYGLDAKGFKYESVEKLYGLPFPVILFWNLNHFVVLEGFDRQRVFINDPAQGPRELTLQELDVAYSGIVLTLKPGPDFKKGGNAPDMLPALRRRLVGSEKALAFTIVCGLFLVVPGLVVPTFTRLFIDSYLVAGQAWLIRPLLLAMGLTIVIQGALTWLQKYYLLRLETKLALSTSSNFFRHILRLPAAYFGQRFAGEIGSRVLINDKVARIVSGKLATTAIDLAMTVFYAALMMFYSVSMTFAVIAIAALNAAAIKLSARARTDASRRLTQDRGKLGGTGMNGLHDRDAERRGRSGVLCAVDGLLLEDRQYDAGSQRVVSDRPDGPSLRADSVHGDRARPGRAQGDERRTDGRHARRLPDVALELHASAQHTGPVRVDAPGTPGRHEPPG